MRLKLTQIENLLLLKFLNNNSLGNSQFKKEIFGTFLAISKLSISNHFQNRLISNSSKQLTCKNIQISNSDFSCPLTINEIAYAFLML